MAYIAERVFSIDASQKALVLNASEFVRKLSIGNDWNQISVGILAAAQWNGTVQNRLMPFSIGMCADMSGASPKSTKHFVGGYTTGGVMTYNANSGSPYYAFGTSFARKIGTTATLAGVGTITFNAPVIEGPLRRAPFWITITRNSTSQYGVQYFTMGTTGMATDFQFNNLTESMEQVSSQTAKGFSFSASTANVLGGNDADGDLNTMCIYWGSNIFPLEIYGIAVYRMR
jgi:hypothetical protein